MSRSEPRVAAGLGRTVPALPVRDVPAAAAFYRERLGFTSPHETRDFAVLVRDDATVHLWGASDGSWPTRQDLATRPVRSGAESFLAGTTSCRIEVDDVDGLWEELRARDVLHPTAGQAVRATDFGTREFHAVDLDGNLLTFVRWEEPAPAPSAAAGP